MSGFDFSASHRRLEQVLRQGVEQGDFPGAVAWMACHGEEAPVLAVGQRDPALPHAMGSDAVFWIASIFEIKYLSYQGRRRAKVGFVDWAILARDNGRRLGSICAPRN